jgi:hypothetical protein
MTSKRSPSPQVCKALTICQPWAHLIITPQNALPPHIVVKRVENRTWPTKYRGPLLIHAGKSHEWLNDGDEQLLDDMPFGAIVGLVDLIDCVQVVSRSGPGGKRLNFGRAVTDKHPWLPKHPHTEGPWCWIVANPVPFAEPVPWRGALGLFDVKVSDLPAKARALLKGAV